MVVSFNFWQCLQKCGRSETVVTTNVSGAHSPKDSHHVVPIKAKIGKMYRNQMKLSRMDGYKCDSYRAIVGYILVKMKVGQ